MADRLHGQPLGWTRSWLYASGNLGKNILWNTAEVTLLFVLTDMLGINPAVAGALLLASLLVDAVLDPVLGYLAERMRSPIGQYGPLLLTGVPVAFFSFVGLYALPSLGRADLWLVAIALFAFRLGYTLIDVPHNALMAKATSSSMERTRIAGLRFVFSSLASLVLALSLGGLVLDSEALSPGWLLGFALVCGGISSVFMVTAWLAVRRRDAERLPRPDQARTVRALARAIRRNTAYLKVLVIAGIIALTLPLFAKGMLYYARYVLGDAGLASPGLSAMVIGQIVGLPLWTALAYRRGNSHAMGGAHLWLAGACGLFFLFGAAHFWSFVILCFLVGIGAGGVYALIWAMVADSVDEGEARSGLRVEAMLFALVTLVQKASIGAGALLVGAALDGAGYVAGAEASPAIVLTLTSAVAAIPILGSILCIGILMCVRPASGSLQHLGQGDPSSR